MRARGDGTPCHRSAGSPRAWEGHNFPLASQQRRKDEKTEARGRGAAGRGPLRSWGCPKAGCSSPHTHFSLSLRLSRPENSNGFPQASSHTQLQGFKIPAKLLPPSSLLLCAHTPHQGPVSSLASDLRSPTSGSLGCQAQAFLWPCSPSRHQACFTASQVSEPSSPRHPHCSDEETEAQKGGRTCLRWHRWTRSSTAPGTHHHLPEEGSTPSSLTVAILAPFAVFLPHLAYALDSDFLSLAPSPLDSWAPTSLMASSTLRAAPPGLWFCKALRFPGHSHMSLPCLSSLAYQGEKAQTAAAASLQW